MQLGHWFRPPRYLLTLFLAVTLAACGALAWLGWRLLDQERTVAAQHARDRLESAADRVTGIFQRSLHDLEDHLANGGDGLPENAVLVTGGAQVLQAKPPERLVFYPSAPVAAGPPPDAFRDAEAKEFGGADAARAIEAYRELARSANVSIRAGALLRLGRTLRKAGSYQEALQIYAELQPLGALPVSGLPASLVAREARCSVLEAMGRRGDLAREAQALDADLGAGRYQLERASWTFFSEEAKAWAGASSAATARLDDAIALSSAVESLWNRAQELRPSGSALSVYEGQPVLAIWKSEPQQLTAVFAGRRYLEAVSRQAAGEAGVRVAISDLEGAPLLGEVAGAVAERNGVSTHQPWNIRISSADPKQELLEDATQRRLLLSGLGIMGALILAGGYFTFRGIHRELAVAQLQSDFVSAVSHEFRTPLTSMRQLSQMLAHGRVIHEGRRQQYYDVLSRESERLHRLVEGLLNFSRMEAGAKPYKFEPVEANELVRSVAGEFARQFEDCKIEISAPEAPCIVRADREALALALWNLLDNAQKYSPECRMVWVSAAHNGARAEIAVRDQGCGIPPVEQRRIFHKFVRGSGALGAGVQGAGIGLAMVKNIMKAHGGDVRLESTPAVGQTSRSAADVHVGLPPVTSSPEAGPGGPAQTWRSAPLAGRGSTFTLVIPLEQKT